MCSMICPRYTHIFIQEVYFLIGMIFGILSCKHFIKPAFPPTLNAPKYVTVNWATRLKNIFLLRVKLSVVQKKVELNLPVGTLTFGLRPRNGDRHRNIYSLLFYVTSYHLLSCRLLGDIYKLPV